MYKMQSKIYNTVKPLLMETQYKGHNRNNLHIKDRFNGPKLNNFIS